MTHPPEFREFAKIARLSREIKKTIKNDNTPKSKGQQ